MIHIFDRFYILFYDVFMKLLPRAAGGKYMYMYMYMYTYM